MGVKVLVTGGAGFIGSHIADELVSKGHETLVLDNLYSGKRRNVNPEAEFHKVNLANSERVRKVFKKEEPDYIIHHAAHNDFMHSFEAPILDLRSNIIGTINLILNGIEFNAEKIIYASSAGLSYGDPEDLPIQEDDEIRLLGPYAISKYAAEWYIKSYCRRHKDFDYTIFRYGNVYGPRQDPNLENPEEGNGVVPLLIWKLLNEEQPNIFGDGTHTRDFVYVKDVVKANMMALEKGDNETFLVGSGKETSINELYKKIKNLMNSEFKLKHKPARTGDQRRCVLNISRIREEMGWEPSYSLKEGLKETIQYLKELKKRVS